MEEQPNKPPEQQPAGKILKGCNWKILYFLGGVVITLIVAIPWMYFASQSCPALWWRF